MRLKPIYASSIFFTIFVLIFISGCGTSHEDSDIKELTKTPVTITYVSIEPMTDTVWLNAISGYMRKNVVKASVTGLIENININIGDQVEKGQLLFTLVTKEAAAFKKTSSIDTSLSFNGEINIKASKSGVITSITHQKGDYVQEGDELAGLSEQSSLVFILSVPFELREYIKIKESCKIRLSNNLTVSGVIDRKLPIMDLQSQTENYIVLPNTQDKLPENLSGKIYILKNKNTRSQVLPKHAMLANETLTEFWVMKLVNDSTAVKIPITKGMETDTKVEIVNPIFLKSDRILLTGNYGLPDTAKIVLPK